MDIHENEENSEFYYDYSILPPHILTSIISNLSIIDFKNATRVCSTWYDASLRPMINKKLHLYLDNIKFNSKNEQEFDHLLNGNRYFSTLTFRYVKFNKYTFDKFWNKFGESIHHIAFINCTMNNEILMKILLRLPNLESFEYHALNQESTFRNGELLEQFQNNKTLSENISKITTLKLSGACQLTVLRQVFGNISNLVEFSYSNFPSGYDKLSTESVFQYLSQFQENLKSLNLAMSVDIYYYNTDSIQVMEKMRLHKFRVSSLEMSDEAFDRFCKSQKELKHFYISKLVDTELFKICNSFPKLNYLEVDELVGTDLLPINQLKDIEHLIFNRKSIANEQIALTLFLENKPKLCVLKLNDEITTNVLNKITETCPNLEELFLISVKGDNSKEMHIIFNKLTKLHKLTINNIEYNSRNGGAFDEKHTILNLKQLKLLKLKGNFSGVLLKDVIKLNKLVILDITKEFQATPQDILQLIENCKILEELSFYNVSTLDDEMVNKIKESLPNLRLLNVFGCKNATPTVYVNKF